MRLRVGSISLPLVMCLGMVPGVTEVRGEDGWVSLFNGKDLSGWEGDAAAWEVRDGAISTTGGKTDKNWLIWRGGEPADFELRLKFRFEAGNSGVQVRSAEIEKWQVRGYQVEIAAHHKMGLWHHSLAPEKKRSHLATAGQRVRIAEDGKKTVEQLRPADEVKATCKDGEWNELVVRAVGPRLVQTINGVVYSDLTDEEAAHARRSGVIALQDHGKGCKAQFKDIRLKVLTPANFRRENLVAWCVVPFDLMKRGPAGRAAMLKELGFNHCAYDWRQEHVPQFEEEIRQYKEHGISFHAFWNEHEDAFALFEKHGIRPQVWKTLKSPKEGSQAEKVAQAVEAMTPLAERTKALGCRLGLYNHGGWGGEPENLVAVCRELRRRGHEHVGIVYNFHHGHGHIDGFAESLALMKPYLLCVNLNGMADPATVKGKTNKILPIGAGKHEEEMIKAVIASGYTGPIGILGHRFDEDVKVTLQNNLNGLETILNTLTK